MNNPMRCKKRWLYVLKPKFALSGHAFRKSTSMASILNLPGCLWWAYDMRIYVERGRTSSQIPPLFQQKVICEKWGDSGILRMNFGKKWGSQSPKKSPVPRRDEKCAL